METKIAERSKIASIAKRCDRRSRSDVIEASRSDVIEDRRAIEASRSDAPGASQMMTRRGLKGEAPPARHHRAIADAPPRYYPANLTRQHLLFIYINPYRIPASACHEIRHGSRRKNRASFTKTKSVAAPS